MIVFIIIDASPSKKALQQGGIHGGHQLLPFLLDLRSGHGRQMSPVFLRNGSLFGVQSRRGRRGSIQQRRRSISSLFKSGGFVATTVSWKAGGRRFGRRGDSGGGSFLDLPNHAGDGERRGLGGGMFWELVVGAEIQDETLAAKGHDSRQSREMEEEEREDVEAKKKRSCTEAERGMAGVSQHAAQKLKRWR
jgi:hypothetical protein